MEKILSAGIFIENRAHISYFPPLLVRCLIKVEEAGGGGKRRLLAVHSKTHEHDILKHHPLIQCTFSRPDGTILANRVFNLQPQRRS